MYLMNPLKPSQNWEQKLKPMILMNWKSLVLAIMLLAGVKNPNLQLTSAKFNSLKALLRSNFEKTIEIRHQCQKKAKM